MVNFRNLWKVGRKLNATEEETDLSGFPLEEGEIETENEADVSDVSEGEEDDAEGDVMETESGAAGADADETVVETGMEEKESSGSESRGNEVDRDRSESSALVPENTGISRPKYFTRSGREVKPRQQLDL